jgi:hypothetical protein
MGELTMALGNGLTDAMPVFYCSKSLLLAHTLQGTVGHKHALCIVFVLC